MSEITADPGPGRHPVVPGAMRRAIARDGAVTTRRIMSATLSSDHRVVDGVGAARFLGTLKALLKAPAAWARLGA